MEFMFLKKFFAKNGEEIILRTLRASDLKRVKEFRNFINSIIAEDDFISMNRKRKLKEERDWLKNNLNQTKSGKKVLVIAENKGKIIGNCMIASGEGVGNHIGILGIAIVKEKRGIGIGKELIEETINFAKNKLRFKLKIIRLPCMETNKAAQNLYRKVGFKEVAKIPKQIQRKGKLISEIVMLKYL